MAHRENRAIPDIQHSLLSRLDDLMQQNAGARFPRETRLRGRDAFGRIFRNGEGLRRGQLVLKYRVGSTAGSDGGSEQDSKQGLDGGSGTGSESPGKQLHAGFVVRRSAGANARKNRLRRLLREAYRLQRNRFEEALPDGIALDLIFLWSGSPEQALRPSFDAIRNDVGAALAALLSRMRKRVADGTEGQR